jgi:hypothetical protein
MLPQDDIDEILASNGAPADIFALDYDSFLQKRAELLLEEAQKLIA